MGEYKDSNRYKLSLALKKTGIASRRLSHAIAGNETYFYNYIGEARFNKKGDISNKTLENILIDLHCAERKLIAVKSNPIIEPKYTISKKLFWTIIFFMFLFCLGVIAGFVKQIF